MLLDPYQAIERIHEELDIEMENDFSDIEKGVIAIRKVRNRR